MAATQPGGRFYTLQGGVHICRRKATAPVGEGFQPSRPSAAEQLFPQKYTRN